MTAYDIMVDIDDVVFPTMASIHARALDKGLHDGTAPMRWSGWESLTLPGGAPCPPEVYWDLWSEFALDGGYLSTPPIPEAAEALRRLHFAGHRIHFVTARGMMAHGEDIKRWTAEWLEEFAIPHDSLAFASDKAQEMRRQIQAGGSAWSYAIDDRAKNVAALADAGVEAYLLTHEHNHADVGLPRVDTVTQFADIIEEHS